jgi:L-ascorbate metabolism protein UlaG (beta-lactamase superfamily)
MRLRSLVALCALLPSCTFASAGARGVGAFFSPMEKVKKTKTPVRKDVRLSVLWIGHATALVQIDDKVILTDPVFAATVAQLSKRLVEPGLDPEDLPPVDAVLISHMHADHLSLGSLDTIKPKVRALLLPRGGATYVTDFAFPVYELRTWQTWEKDGLRVTAVPVDHTGWRYGVDDAWMKHSFTGYVVTYHDMKVYFGGDTAYDQKNFIETGQRFPDIDVALLPIGPIEPRNLMRTLHMDPREALQAFVDLGAARMVPIHYDTFVSTDARGEALLQLVEAEKIVKHDRARPVVPLAIGEQRVFVKAGEDPAAVRPKATAVPTAAPPAPTPPPKKDDISDDEKLD